MTTQLSDVIKAVHDERSRQDGKWGGPANDDKHSKDDWVRFIREYGAGKTERTRKYNIGARLVKCCALAVAAAQSYQRGLGIVPRDPIEDATASIPVADVQLDDRTITQEIAWRVGGGDKSGDFYTDMLNVIAYTLRMLTQLGLPPKMEPTQ